MMFWTFIVAVGVAISLFGLGGSQIDASTLATIAIVGFGAVVVAALAAALSHTMTQGREARR